MSVARVELFGHVDCCLCVAARETLERLRPELGFELVYRDIAADDALHRAYFERVPVVALDGREVCDLQVDEAILRERLAERRASLGSPDGARLRRPRFP